MAPVDLELILETEPPGDLDLERLRDLAEFVLAQSKVANIGWTVTVMLTDDDHLRALHRAFLDEDSVTDVMTFPLSSDPAADGEWGGDVVVSIDRAVAQAPEFGLTGAEEISFLVVHGLLHLQGWDDRLDEDRVAMLAEQNRLIGAFNARGVSGADTP